MQSLELWRKNLYILWGTQFIAMVGMNLVIPFLPFFVRELGVTDRSRPGPLERTCLRRPLFLSFIATPFWGSMGDKYGRKAMVVRALIGLAVSQLLIGLSQNVYQLFFFRIVQGGTAGTSLSSIALMSTTTPKERIGYALGIMQSSSAAGSVLGPFLGGLLADMIGYREVFFRHRRPLRNRSVLCGQNGAGTETERTNRSRHRLSGQSPPDVHQQASPSHGHYDGGGADLGAHD